MLCNKCHQIDEALFYPYSPTLCKPCYSKRNMDYFRLKQGAMKRRVRAIFRKWCETGIFDANL